MELCNYTGTAYVGNPCPLQLGHECDHTHPPKPAPALPEVAPSDAEYLSRAENFLKQAAKMTNAPVVYMVAAAFRNEDRAKRAEAQLAAAKAGGETTEQAFARGISEAAAQFNACRHFCGFEFSGKRWLDWTYNEICALAPRSTPPSTTGEPK